MKKYPSYLDLHETGELKKLAEKLKEIYKNCVLCPWDCRIDRISGHLGVCKAADKAVISSATPHFGEEPMISGTKGSGTIFFSFCTLRCSFCQNYQISQEGTGEVIDDEALAEKMLELQGKGCHNINLVSPTHFIPNIVAALAIAADKGLNIPIVYNSNGYEKVETLKMLKGVVDIYLPDIKYSDDLIAVKLSDAPKYTDYNRKAIEEMYWQVGDLKMDGSGIAIKGLLVRHLVLPNNLAGSEQSIKFLADEITKNVYIALMSQYTPCYKAGENPDLSRKLIPNEYTRVIRIAKEAGLHNILIQELGSSGILMPDFKKPDPFK